MAVVVPVVVLWLGFAGWQAFGPSPSLAEAQQAVDRAQWDRAAELLSRMLRRRAVPARVRMLAAQVSAQRGDLRQALDHLEHVADADPDAGDAWLRRGQILRELHFARRAEEAWLRAAQLGRADAARWELLELYYLEYRLDEGIRLCWEIYEQGSDRIAALLVLLRFEYERPAPHFGHELVQQFVGNDPDDWDARAALGRYQLSLGLPEAKRVLDECRSAGPKPIEHLRLHMWALSEAGEHAELAQLLKDAPAELPRDAEFWRLQGEVLQEADLNGSRAAFLLALRLDPFDRKTHFQLGRVLRRLGDASAAKQHLDRAAELHATREAGAAHYATVYAHRAQLTAEHCRRMAELVERLGRHRMARAWRVEARARTQDPAEDDVAIRRLDREIERRRAADANPE
jgi:tetratricopeptide (TPR) repeat protein